jgi:PAS domain-containing protein
MRGETRWVHLANQPLISADGSISRYIGVVHDITDRKLNEEVLRSQALTVEVMHEGVVLSDGGGVIRMTNPAFDRMLGAVTGSLIGKRLDALPCDPPLDRRIAESADEAGTRSGVRLAAELTVRVEGEAPLFLEAVITPLVLRGERFVSESLKRSLEVRRAADGAHRRRLFGRAAVADAVRGADGPHARAADRARAARVRGRVPARDRAACDRASRARRRWRVCPPSVLRQWPR